MSASDKNQALTVVIEKLTEIVDNINQRGQHDDSPSSTGGHSPTSEHVVMKIEADEGVTSTFEHPDETTSQKEEDDDDTGGALEIDTEETTANVVFEVEEIEVVNVVADEVTTETTVKPQVPKSTPNAPAPKTLFKCIKCDYCSHNKHYLKQHVVLVHTSERPFKCPLCDYSGKRSHSLKEHLVVHSPYRPFTCPFCRASFRKKGHLTNHLKIHASDQGLPCSICKCTLSNPLEMSKHMRQEHLHEAYLCDECDCATTSEAEMVDHKHSHGNPTVYCCTTCKYITVQESLMRNHISATHNGHGAFTVNTNAAMMSQHAQPLILLKCSECGFVTSDKAKLREHMLGLHVAQTSGSSSRGQASQNAEIASSSSHETSQPISSTAETPRSHQEDCTLSPEARAVDGSHLEYTHQAVNGVYCCMICGYTCDHQRSIKAHIWKHSGRKDINYPIFQTVKRPASSQGTSPGEPNAAGDSGNVHSAEETESMHHDYQQTDISENIPANTAIRSQKTEQNIINEKTDSFEIQDKKFEKPKVPLLNHPQQESECSQHQPKHEASSQNAENDDTKSGVKRKAASYSELDMSIPKLRIIKPEQDSDDDMNSDSQMSYCQVRAKKEKDIRNPVAEIHPGDVPPVTSHARQECHSTQDAVGDEVVIVDAPGEEYVLEHIEVEVETSEDHKNTPSYVEKENVEDLTENPQPVSLRALLQRQRSSGDLEKLATVPARRTRSGSLDAKATEDGPQEQGICSSLLAVIEQFRKDASGPSPTDEETFSERWVEKCQNHYRCRICRYSTLYITSMKTHLRTHARRRPKLCSLCSYVAETDEQLDRHMESHDQNGPFVCRECSKTFPSAAQRQAHMKIHSSVDADSFQDDMMHSSKVQVKQYVCENCDCCFVSIETLLKHKMKKLCWNKHNASAGSDNGSSEEKDCFKCNFCDYVGMSVRSLKSHMKRHWNDLKANQLQETAQLSSGGDSLHGEKYYVCERCTSVFPNIMDLLSHKQNACAGVIPKCMHCSFTSNDSEAFKKHMSLHVGKLYKCEQCDFVSKSYSKMDAHLKQHIEPSDLHCTLCDFIATSVRSLKSHMKRHVNDQRFVRQPLEQYKCKMCGYICHHLPALKSHMWRHASDSSYSYETTNAVINAALELGVGPVGQEPSVAGKPSEGPLEYPKKQMMMPNSADYSRKVIDGLVAFRCCHCFFETCNKTELNEHMKKHIDIIKKTMEVNNDLFLKKDKVNNT